MAIIDYEVQFRSETSMRTEDYFTVDTLKEARALAKRAHPDYACVSQFKQRLYSFGGAKYHGERKVLVYAKVE